MVTGTLVDGAIHVGATRRHRTVALVGTGAGDRDTGAQRSSRSAPGERVALNLASIDHRAVRRGDCIVEPDTWLLTDRFDASLTVLPSLGHDVSRRGAYLAYIGAGEHGVSMRILGGDVLAPGTTGAVRIHLPAALPLLPGDRFVIRESGRDETVGGGEVLDIAPVTKASEAAPDRSLDRLVRERGWLTVGEVEPADRAGRRADDRTLGDARPNRWPHWPTASGHELRRPAHSASTSRSLDDRERAVVDADDRCRARRWPVAVRRCRAIRWPHTRSSTSSWPADSRHPTRTDIDRVELRELIRRGDVVQRDGICFHRDTIAQRRAGGANGCWSTTRTGSPCRQFRDATRGDPQVLRSAVGGTRRTGDHPATRRSAHRRSTVGSGHR